MYLFCRDMQPVEVHGRQRMTWGRGQDQTYDAALKAPFGGGLTGDFFRQFDSQIEDGPYAKRQVRLDERALFGDVNRFGLATWARGSPNAQMQGNPQAVTTTRTALDKVAFIAQAWFSAGLEEGARP